MSALHYSDDLESGYFLELRQEWMAGSFRAALSTAKDARVFISCHGLRQRELFERHGVAAFIGPMPGPLSQMPNLLLETLEDCLAKHLHEIALLQPYKIPHVRMRNRDAVSPKDAKAIVLEFLEIVARGDPRSGPRWFEYSSRRANCQFNREKCLYAHPRAEAGRRYGQGFLRPSSFNLRYYLGRWNFGVRADKPP